MSRWNINVAQAKQVQREWSIQVSTKNEFINYHSIAGVDISVANSNKTACAAIVTLNYPRLDIIEVKTAEGNLTFPYIPGLLSFREIPLIFAAYQKLLTKPDLLLVDGQGIAHPRRFGLASHLGVLLNIPSIGCAKSRLCGHHKPLPIERNAHVELIDNNETIGAVLRTKTNVKPVYISIGHKIDLPSAIHWTLKCTRGYRLPEPTRLAHFAASGKTLKTTPFLMKDSTS